MLTASYHHLLLAIPALLPAYLLRFSIGFFPTNALECLIIAAAGCGLCSSAVRQRWLQVLNQVPPPFLLFAALFLLAASISAFLSPHVIMSLGILKGWIVFPLLYAFFVATAPLSPRRYLPFLLGGSLIVALYSFSDVGRTTRLQAFYDTPNSLALTLSPLVILALFQWLNLRLSLSYRRLAAFTALTLFLSVLGTQSVGAILAIGISAILGFFLNRNQPGAKSTILLIGVIGVGLTALVAIPKIQYLLQPGSSAYVRLQLWSISVELIRQHPIGGIGLGAFEPAYQHLLHQRFKNIEEGLKAIKPPLPEFVFRDPHNWPLSFYLNLGLVGLLSFMVLNYLALKDIFKKSHYLPLQLALIVILLHGLVDTIYWKNDLALLWWLLVTLTIKAQSTDKFQ